MGFGGRLKQKLEKRRASMSHAFSSEGEEDVLSDGESGFFQDEEEMPEKPIVVKRGELDPFRFCVFVVG